MIMGQGGKITRFGGGISDAGKERGERIEVPVKDLIWNASWQRHGEEELAAAGVLIRSMVREWNWALCGAVKCARIDGLLYPFDGSTRVRGAIARGDIETMPCDVWDMTHREAAELFSEQIRVRNLHAYNLYKAGVAAQKPHYLRLDEIVRRYGYTVSKGAGKKAFRAITTLRDLLALNAVRAERAFMIAASICDGETIPNRLLQAIFSYETHMGQLSGPEQDKLSVLGRIGLERALNQKKLECGKMSADVAGQAILDILNKNRSTRRRTWKR